MNHTHIDIAIIGAGLTGLTTAFWLTRAGKKIQIIERQDRAGGQIRTFQENGFVYESGPNTGVVSYPEVAELFAALSPDCTLETAREESKKRWIWKGNKFHALPSGLVSAVTTPLFTLYDKFRILGEPFRAKGTNPDESVAELAARRLGKSFVDYAVDPFLSGVYAGNPHTLVTRHALPKLYNLEQDYGSFIKGSIAKAKLPKSERDKLATKKVFSAVGGLERLAEALVKAIGKEQITLSASEVKIQPQDKQWLINYRTPEGEQSLIANKVVTTCGAYALPDLLPFIPKEDIGQISNLHYAPIIQASVGFHNTRGLQFGAFGGLVPSKEKRDVLGILFPSACFVGRSPEEGALFSFFIGGVRHADMLDWSDEKLKDMILKNIHSMLKFPADAQPDLIKIHRHQKAIPQYEKSSEARFKMIEELQIRYPGLILAGNIKGGIGMADRIRQATGIAKEIAS
ncbi:MAG: protoporphyrinogen oxidase [Bacteroides sp.]|nr:protoporphyrinogen oxidase [Bacteroides sp.]